MCDTTVILLATYPEVSIKFAWGSVSGSKPGGAGTNCLLGCVPNFLKEFLRCNVIAFVIQSLNFCKKYSRGVGAV